MPLNLPLFRRLQSQFGDVKIANSGVQGLAYETRLLGGARRWRIDQWGESYRVCCPFCGDQRYRLWLNWR